MAQASQFWHTRPAILTVTGIAAAGCIIFVYNAYTKRSSTSHLRRSNAVHRPRRERHMPTISSSSATPGAPLGTVVIRRGEDSYLINLANDPLPAIDELQQLFTHANEGTQTELLDVVLDLVLSACVNPTDQGVSWTSIQEFGLGNLSAAMASRDENQIRLHASDIRRVLRLDGVSDEQIERAVSKFFSSELWLGSLETSAEDDEGADPAETEEVDLLDASGREPSQGLRGLLYYIAEEDAKRKAYEHRGIHCEECGEAPIRGVRWHCLNCSDFDLCASCETHTEHPKTHVFAKIKIPLPILSQPTKPYNLWYPGDPRKIHPPLDAAFRKRLCHEHDFEDPQMDALYDQFTCLANVPWQSDSSNVKAAIDKRAFNKAMSCEKWASVATSNALYDRMFSFYDTDGNGLIGFEEFLSGFAYLRGPQRFASLQRTIKGYDMNGDGFVDRADFMRLLRAKFTIQQQLIRDSIEGQEIEQTQSALEVLRSSQPISSVFTQEDIPPGESRPRRGKHLDGFGDMRPLKWTKTILDDEDPWHHTSRERNRPGLPAHARLRNNLLRFEELLHGSTNRQHQRDVSEQVDGSSPLFVTDEYEECSPEQDLQLDFPSLNSEEDELVEPHIHNILWQATEDGFNSLLDTLFLAKEQEDQEVVATRDERAKWRKEVEAVAEEEQQIEEQLGNAAMGDSLMADAMSSYQTTVTRRESAAAASTTPPFTGSIVPTDWQSLERREQDISDTSLDELLRATGYSLRTGDEVGADETTPQRTVIGSSPWPGDFTEHPIASPPRRATSNETLDTGDPTLPQNMPERDVSVSGIPALRRKRGMSAALNTVERSPERPPSRRRLKYLSSMDEVDRQLRDRGGPGRLTYDEIEAITVTEGPELRGLIKSWLEWASF